MYFLGTRKNNLIASNSINFKTLYENYFQNHNFSIIWNDNDRYVMHWYRVIETWFLVVLLEKRWTYLSMYFFVCKVFLKRPFCFFSLWQFCVWALVIYAYWLGLQMSRHHSERIKWKFPKCMTIHWVIVHHNEHVNAPSREHLTKDLDDERSEFNSCSLLPYPILLLTDIGRRIVLKCCFIKRRK